MALIINLCAVALVFCISIFEVVESKPVTENKLRRPTNDVIIFDLNEYLRSTMRPVQRVELSNVNNEITTENINSLNSDGSMYFPEFVDPIRGSQEEGDGLTDKNAFIGRCPSGTVFVKKHGRCVKFRKG